MIDSESPRSYYCSMKFRYLKVDLANSTSYNCHAAKPHPIDFEWIENNQGNLFNTDVSVKERQMMLRNERNSSCEQNCWAAEDRGAISPRLYQKGTEKTHLDPVTTPEIIDLTVSKDCNLTCSYCCKEFSSAWRRDVIDNGDYVVTGMRESRYQAVPIDKILNNISQTELHDSRKYRLLADEIRCCASTLKQLVITGGEPLLDNQLIDMLSSLDLGSDCQIMLYTGLGVSPARFERLVSKLSGIANLQIQVSAENIGEFLEFNRYGIQWPEFQKKLDILDRQLDWRFHCTVSNLTLFGFPKFEEFFQDRPMALTFAFQPGFMSPFVLDPMSKQKITEQIENMRSDFRDQIVTSMSAVPSDIERQGTRDFLIEFVKRRPNLDLGIFPASFLDWLEVDHVV